MDRCPDCRSLDEGVLESEAMTRRRFVQTVGATAAAVTVVSAIARAEDAVKPTPETLVKKLFDSLDAKQKEEVCFAWDFKDDRGVLRTHVSNNWQITDKKLNSGFYNKDQQDIIEALFWGM